MLPSRPHIVAMEWRVRFGSVEKNPVRSFPGVWGSHQVPMSPILLSACMRARQEQLKELSRELEQTNQDNRHLQKKLQDLATRVQNCDGCAKLKTQIRTMQDSNGKRIVDIPTLKPIKDTTIPLSPQLDTHQQDDDAIDQRSDFITPTDEIPDQPLMPPAALATSPPLMPPPASPPTKDLEILRQPQIPVVRTTIDSPSEARMVERVTVSLVDNAVKINKEDEEENNKGMFDRIRHMFGGGADSDVYGTYSIQTSNCSVCRAARGEPSPESDDFKIYGPMSVNSPGMSSDGSFCPVCQTREEHERGHDSSDTPQIEYNDLPAL
eukprot:sb/3466794/